MNLLEIRTQLDTFTRAYIECALWSSLDQEDEPLDSAYDASDLHPSALAAMVADCAAFQADNAQHLETVSELCDSSRAGFCFWLNRNGHGSGFWDEYSGSDKTLYDAFENLSQASKAFGSFDLYEADADENGRVLLYAHGYEPRT